MKNNNFKKQTQQSMSVSRGFATWEYSESIIRCEVAYENEDTLFYHNTINKNILVS